MSDHNNLRHWNVLGRTDPKQTKQFKRAGGFSGTATKPIWTEYRLTQHFGPCGVGWGCDEPVFTQVQAGEEILVYCTLRCWYAEDGKIASLYGVGGDKVLVKRNDGKMVADDEAFKKAFTDALGNAFKHVGSGADVHMGLFEDSKYVAEVRREFAEDTPPAPAPAPVAATVDPERAIRAARATATRDRIKTAITNAETAKIIDGIIKVNAMDLAFIKEVYAPSYEALMSYAETRKSELLEIAA